MNEGSSPKSKSSSSYKRKKRNACFSIDSTKKNRYQNTQNSEEATPTINWREKRNPREQEAINYLIELSDNLSPTEHSNKTTIYSRASRNQKRPTTLNPILLKSSNIEEEEQQEQKQPPVQIPTTPKILKPVEKSNQIYTPLMDSPTAEDETTNFVVAKRAQSHDTKQIEVITQSVRTPQSRILSGEEAPTSITLEKPKLDLDKENMRTSKVSSFIDRRGSAPTNHYHHVFEVPKLKLDEYQLIPLEINTPQSSARGLNLRKPNEKLMNNAKRLNMHATQRKKQPWVGSFEKNQSPRFRLQNLSIDMGEHVDYLRTVDQGDNTQTRAKNQDETPKKIFSRYPVLKREPNQQAFRVLNKRAKQQRLAQFGAESPVYQSLVNSPRSSNRDFQGDFLKKGDVKILVRRLRSMNKKDERRFVSQISNKPRADEESINEIDPALLTPNQQQRRDLSLANNNNSNNVSIDIDELNSQLKSTKNSPHKSHMLRNSFYSRPPKQRAQQKDPSKIFLQKKFQEALNSLDKEQQQIKYSHMRRRTMAQFGFQ